MEGSSLVNLVVLPILFLAFAGIVVWYLVVMNLVNLTRWLVRVCRGAPAWVTRVCRVLGETPMFRDANPPKPPAPTLRG